MSPSNWSFKTRFLHIGLALTVTTQLAVSLLMEPPDKEEASALARTAFEIHEAVGMTALLIVLTHWLWSLLGRADGGLARLFPWRGAALAEVTEDLRQVLRGRLPQGGPRGGLPGLVHGLGLLAVTGMALSGAGMFFLFPESGKPEGVVELFEESHEFIATFVWIYWGGHVGLALLHRLSGHDTVGAMFNLRR